MPKHSTGSLYALLVRYYDELFPLKEEKRSFVKSFLTKTSARILDIGCATGSLAVRLAVDSHRVRGIDLDAGMIGRARERARDAGVNVDFRAADMMDVRSLFPGETMDMILCLGNTLAHLPDPEALKTFLKEMFSMLAAGGVCILQVVNFAGLMAKGISELPPIETGELLFERRYDYSAPGSRIGFLTRLVLKKERRCMEDRVMLYPVAYPELEEWMKQAGFAKRLYYGDFRAAPYAGTSPALVAVGVK